MMADRAFQRLGAVNWLVSTTRSGQSRAIYVVQTARRVNHGPISAGYPGNVGYEGAIDAARHALRENPNQRLSFRWLVAALGQLGRSIEAQIIVSDLASAMPPAWFDEYWSFRWPWMREEDVANL